MPKYNQKPLIGEGEILLILTVCIVVVQTLNAQTVELLNGKDLSGWRVWTEGAYDNYKLYVEWRWNGEPNNSGIFVKLTPLK